MGQWQMDTDTSDREKIVGGLIDGVQLLFILAGLAAGLLFAFLFKPFLGVFSFILFVLLGLIAGGLFAFVKLKELSLFDYLRSKEKHKNKTKEIINVKNIDDLKEI